MIYEPLDDTYLLCETIEKKIERKNLKILEMGFGSGYILEFLHNRGFKNLIGADINGVAVKNLKKKGFNAVKSNLFSDIHGKFDLIVFNPPYLPHDKDEDNESSIITTGGKHGSEIINRFLRDAKNHLTEKGKIFLLISSLTKGIDCGGYNKNILSEKKLFFEKLEVWELAI